jgi:hypothetical protein
MKGFLASGVSCSGFRRNNSEADETIFRLPRRNPETAPDYERRSMRQNATPETT